MKALNFLARVLGVFWMLGGVAFLVGAFVGAEDRVLHFVIGIFILLAGVGFILAKPAKSDDVEKVKIFARRFGDIGKR